MIFSQKRKNDYEVGEQERVKRDEMAGLLTPIPTEPKCSEAIGLYPKKGKEALLFHM